MARVVTGFDGADRDTVRAVELAGRVERLEAELAGLRRGMRTRGVIEQAKGRLIERHGIDEQEAFRRLVHYSQRSGRRVAEVAAELATGTPDGCASAPAAWRRHVATLRDHDTVVGAVDVVWQDGSEEPTELTRR